MSLKEQSYSILVVSATESFNVGLLSLLPEFTYHTIRTIDNIYSAKRMTAEQCFDFVIVNSPLPDDVGVNFAIDTCLSKQTVVLLVVKNEIYAEINEKVTPHGVFTLPKPTSKPIMLRSLDWMISARERLRQFEKKTLSFEEKMTEIRLVNRAKWLLISELQMDEPGAHRYIEKQAMDTGSTKKSIAEKIIQTYS